MGTGYLKVDSQGHVYSETDDWDVLLRKRA